MKALIYRTLVELAMVLVLRYMAKNNISLKKLLDIVLTVETTVSEVAEKQKRARNELKKQLGENTPDSTVNLTLELGILLMKLRGLR